MLKLKAVLYRALSLALVVFIGVLCARSDIANADGSPAPALPSDTLTHFESFILTNCIPCVRELYSIATVPIPSIKAPAFSGVAPVNPATTTRGGELRFELLRAYPVGLESREHFAMRVVLSVSVGSEGALYPLGAGLLDEDEVPALAAALSQMSKSMPPEPTIPLFGSSTRNSMRIRSEWVLCAQETTFLLTCRLRRPTVRGSL